MSELTDCEWGQVDVFQCSRNCQLRALRSRDHRRRALHLRHSESQNRHQASSRNWLNQPSFAAQADGNPLGWSISLQVFLHFRLVSIIRSSVFPLVILERLSCWAQRHSSWDRQRLNSSSHSPGSSIASVTPYSPSRPVRSEALVRKLILSRTLEVTQAKLLFQLILLKPLPKRRIFSVTFVLLVPAS